MSAVLEADGIEALRADVGMFRGEIANAIDSLVTGLLELQNGQLTPLEQRARGLEDRVRALEQLGPALNRIATDLHVAQSCLHLAETSRMTLKTRTVVFVARSHFGCNLKYAWLGALERADQAGYECWFLPANREQQEMAESLGARCLPWHFKDWTPAHVQLALETAVLVIGDHYYSITQPHNPYGPALFKGARWVQLWHGISIKEIALKYPIPLREMKPGHAQALASCGHYAAFVGSSRGARDEWRRWFGFSRYAAVGYPRSDVLLREPTERDLLNVDLDAHALARRTRAAGGRVVLYAPTFRDGEMGTWIYNAGLSQLAGALAERGDRLLVNLHPLESGELPRLSQTFPDVHFVRERTDLYPLLREASLLVTDYSSLMFDFLPLRRPMLFYRPDHERYTEQSRPLYAGKVRQLPGATCDSLQALLDCLSGDMAALDAPYAGIRDELATRLFDRIDDQSTARVLALIEQELNAALATQS